MRVGGTHTFYGRKTIEWAKKQTGATHILNLLDGGRHTIPGDALIVWGNTDTDITCYKCCEVWEFAWQHNLLHLPILPVSMFDRGHMKDLQAMTYRVIGGPKLEGERIWGEIHRGEKSTIGWYGQNTTILTVYNS